MFEKFKKQLDFNQKLGFAFLSTGLVIYLLPLLQKEFSTNLNGLGFIIIFILSSLYYLIVWAKGSRKSLWYRPIYNRHFFYAISLFYISAFALNRSFSIFGPFPLWLTIYFVLSLLIFGLICYIRILPKKVHKPLLLLFGVSWILHLYMALYLLPILPEAVLVFWFFGLSLHAFVSLFAFLRMTRIVIPYLRTSNFARYFTGGVAIPLLIIAVFLIGFSSYKSRMQELFAERTNYLPQWIVVDQYLEKNWLNLQFLKLASEYNLERGSTRFFPSFGRNTLHQPLLIMASMLPGSFPLNSTTAQQMLGSNTGSRDNFTTRLWNGEDLVTTNIKTEIEVFPEHRMAYFQKTFVIKNTGRSSTENFTNQQEAIYTFYLPEGAVATSLSLWVEGEERPARLTTKGKANTAYSTIVGRERRDPALMNWHEGNRISVNVFPCTPEEDRKFKVGFTIPLADAEKALLLGNIHFRGPDPGGASEETIFYLRSAEKFTNFSPGQGFSSDGSGKWRRSGSFNGGWLIRLPKPEFSTEPFVFAGNTYQLQPVKSISRRFNAELVILDINGSWTYQQAVQAYDLAQNYAEPAVFLNGKVHKLSEENRQETFSKLLELNYSLPPLHKISNPSKTLVITKSAAITPTPKDFKGWQIHNEIEYFIHSNKKVHVLDLGNFPTPYLQTLNEFGKLQYYPGNLDIAESFLSDRYFAYYDDDESRVNLASSGISIVRQQDSAAVATAAPSHLMRIFNAKKVVQQLGQHYNQQQNFTDETIHLALAANVVTPFSSLVTLETDTDYERFNIKKQQKDKHLGNSFIGDNLLGGGDGAVPEPHEWVLIILGGTFLLYLLMKRMGFMP